jgi:16S rRNA (cytidine1402-2'-O)-methyltransferase
MLYIVATPIGNLKDITLRAIETLKSVDLILCEDTRVTRKLLSHYNIHKPLISCHKHSPFKIYNKILSLINKGKKLALTTDSGTPGISDPGNKLIKFLLSSSKHQPPLKITPVPGPSALTAALSISGINDEQFIFLGFPPRKKGRGKFFSKISQYNLPAILYESPHRLRRTLKELKETLGKNKKLIICRELTKIYEEIFRGTLEKAEIHFQNKTKGEFVIIIDAKNHDK